jgi:hypothetical protein
MLSERDRRALAELEVWLRRDDPCWTANFDAAESGLRFVRSGRARVSLTVTVLAVLAAAVSLLVGQVVLTLICLMIALTAWTVPRCSGPGTAVAHRRRFR